MTSNEGGTGVNEARSSGEPNVYECSRSANVQPESSVPPQCQLAAKLRSSLLRSVAARSVTQFSPVEVRSVSLEILQRPFAFSSRGARNVLTATFRQSRQRAEAIKLERLAQRFAEMSSSELRPLCVSRPVASRLN
jgi:hypothetical protein